MHHPLPKVTAVPDDAAASDANALLDDLDPEQRAAVTSTGAPLCIVAGPGAGKTRVLTRRVAYRLATATADPGHVLVITFTRKAATELNRRLGALGPTRAGSCRHVPRRRARPAAPALDRGRHHRPVSARPQSRSPRAAGQPVGQARRASAVRAARRCRGRDRMGEGAHDQPRCVRGPRATKPAAGRR